MKAKEILEVAADMVERTGCDATMAILAVPPFHGFFSDFDGAFDAFRREINIPKGTPLKPWLDSKTPGEQTEALRRAAKRAK